MIERILPLLAFISGILICFLILRNYYKKNINNFSDKNIKELEDNSLLLTEKYNQQQKEIEELKSGKNDLNNQIQTLIKKNAVLETEKIETEKTINNRKLDIEELKKQLPDQFKNLANEIFTQKTSLFKTESKDTLDQIINPLNKEIEKLKNNIDIKFGNESKERHLLQNELKKLVNTHDQSNKELSKFTEAITKDSKEQGDLGELVLEQLLIDAGLVENKNYILQAKDLRLKDSEGKTQQPDVILKIPPGNKHIIIDSKVSLTHFVNYNTESDENLKKIHLKKFLESVKTHITQLNSKRYQDQYKLKSLEYVIMFMPRRNAYELATKSDPNLLILAENNDIMIAHEGSIVALLKLIYRMWRLEGINQDALDVIKKADLLDKQLNDFYKEYYEKIGNQLTTVLKTYDAGKKRIATGREPILTKSSELKKISFSSKKD